MSKKAQSAAKYAALSKSKKKKAPNHSSIPVSNVPYAEYEPSDNGSSKKVTEINTIAQSRRRKVSQIDYHYVVSDIKRIAIIGGSMLALLVVLSQIIR